MPRRVAGAARSRARPGSAVRRARARRICCRRFARRRRSRAAPAIFRWRSSPASASACWKVCRSSIVFAWTISTAVAGRAGVGDARSSALLREVEDAAARWSWRRGRRRRCCAWALPDLGSRCAAGAVLPAAASLDESGAAGRRCSCARGCAGSSCRRRPRAGCSAVSRATCARSTSCSTRSMRRRSPRSGG